MKTTLILLTFCTLTFIPLVGTSQTVPDFKLTNVLNGQTISLDTYPSCAGIVLIFTSNSCPYDEYYLKRIEKLSQTYQDKVPVLLVNAHTEPNESADKMAARGKSVNMNVPYLSDKDQTLVAALNVKKSPEAFLLKNDGGKFKVVYRGAIDDNAQVEADVHHHYLRDAIDIMLNNQNIETPEVRPVGCNLKKKA